MYALRVATSDDVIFLTDVVIATAKDRGDLPADAKTEYRRDFAAWTAEQVADAGSPSTTYVVETSGRPVGRLRVVRSDDAVKLAGIQLLPSAQSQGIGSSIVADLIAEASAGGLTLTLTVDADNLRAQALYRRLGFVESGWSEGEICMTFAARQRH